MSDAHELLRFVALNDNGAVVSFPLRDEEADTVSIFI
jgi:hypothetical protein